jgi:hypothetical protein
MKKFGILLYIVLFLLLCGPKQDKVERIIEDGVEVVVNHLEPYKIGSQSSFMLEEILTIDTENEAIANLGIPGIFGFAVNSSGEIYLLREIKGDGGFVFKFDAEGKFLKSFARFGQGPGELQNPHYIAADSKNNILVFDLNTQTIRKYNQEGIFIEDLKLKGGNAAVTPGPRENLLMIGREYDRDKETAIFIYSLKLANSNLEVLQVLDEFRNEVSPNQLKFYEPIFCCSTSKDNIYTANENRGYDIWVYDFNGKLVRKIKKEYKKIPVSEEFKEKTLKQIPKEMQEQLKDKLYFPEFQPPIQNLVTGENGLLMVATFETGGNPGEFLYDIFNPDGVFIGKTSLNIWLWEGILWARIKAGKFYILREKPNGYRELAVYNMIWE